MISSKAIKSMAFVVVAVSGIHVMAAEPTAAEIYGQGVHAYFAGDYDSAIELMTESLEKNAGDPRAYYVRGLALASRAGAEAGLADFARAAELEVNPVDEKFYDVNEALQRVQGHLRMVLERQRSAVKKAAAERKRRQDRIRYEQLKQREDVVLYRPDEADKGSDQPAEEPALELPEVDLGEDGGPFASGAAFSGGEIVESAAPSLVAEPKEVTVGPSEAVREESDEPVAGATDLSESPFGDIGPVAKPSEEKKKPAAADVFDAENLFGEEAAKTPADNPLFDESVRPEVPMSMDLGGNMMDALQKTLSGEAGGSADRDPFSEGTPAAAPKSKTAAERETPAEEGGESKKKPEFDDNPFE